MIKRLPTNNPHLYPPVALMAVYCFTLGATWLAAASGALWAPAWFTSAGFYAAALGCVVVMLVPNSMAARAMSGWLVSAAFAFRAVDNLMANMVLKAGRPTFAIALYLGMSLFVSLSWHRILPPRPEVRRRFRGLSSNDSG